MNHSSVKKQNRVLLWAMVIILLTAAILIAVTGGANRKEREENPPLDTEITEKTSEKSETDKKLPAESSALSEDALKKPETSKSSETKTDAEKSEPKESDTDRSSEEKAEKTAAVSAMRTDLMPTFTLPVDAPVQKGFSGETPVFSFTMNDYRTHTGIDFICEKGTPVLAAADGTICEVVDDPMMGVCVGISHTGGAVTRYCGLSEESLTRLSVGDSIGRGEAVGSAGDTSLIESAEDNHLHFELKVNGCYENPADFMKVRYLSEIVED